MKFWTRADWLIILVFGLLVALFYWRILTPNLADRQSFPPGDFQAQFWAFATHEVRELSAGRLPLWNPYTFAGAPFWADVQSAVFYPPSLLTILLSAPWGFSLFALEVEAIAHFWLAAIFMYLFTREVTGSRAAAIIAALTFTFSGYLTGYPSQQLAVLEADVWLPLILFFLHRNYHLPITNTPPQKSLPIPQSSHLLLAGIAWGMTLLAGHPQSALIVAYVSAAYFFFLHFITPHASRTTPYNIRAARENIGEREFGGAPPNPPGLRRVTYPVLRSTFQALAGWLTFIAAGLGLAAVQFIPAVEYTLRSVRAEGAYEKMSGGFPITDIIQLVLPGQVSLYSPLYVGVVGLLLALWVVFSTPSRHAIFWGVAALVTLLISFGGNTFLYSPLYLFTPGFSIFRGQERWAFAAAFSLSVLAGYGFKLLTMNNYQLSKNTRHLSRFTLYLLLFALLLDFLFFHGLNDTGWSPDSPFYGLLGASTLLTILLALTWLLWHFSTRLPALMLTGCAAALICFDLFSVNWQTNLYPQPPEWHTRLPQIVAAIKNDAAQWPGEPYRVYNEFRLYDNYGVPYQIEDLWGASPLRPDRYDKFLAPPMPIERAWELLNVKYVITWRQELFAPSEIIYQEPAPDGVTYLHRLESVGPRAWLVHQTQLAGDAAILQTIADPNFDRWHIALLESDSSTLSHLLTLTQTEKSTHHATRSTSHASRLTYQVTTSAPALLILSEPYDPGWQATVDGQPAPLLRADYALRAVPVPAGQHTVELTFRPLSFTIGAIISVVTFILLTCYFAIRYIQRDSKSKIPKGYFVQNPKYPKSTSS